MSANALQQRGASRLDRGDKRLMWALTLIYTVFTLLNLGTLRFPQTVWTAPSEPVVLEFSSPAEISTIRLNGNIAVGTVQFMAEDGTTATYEQTYGDMFGWKDIPVYMLTRSVTVTGLAGEPAFNEIAFLTADGTQVIPAVRSGDGAAMVDEQDTVPETPGYMNGMYFDEIYHARTAYEFLHTMNVYEWTHPPLGKVFIALGIVLFGMTPFGWRVIPALFGAGMLPILFVLGKRLFRRRDYACLGAALFALDTMHFTQSRIATVDVFIVFFILLMFLFMYDYLQTDFLRASAKELYLPLGACGVSFGLGVASKWTGLYAGVGLAVLFFVHLIRCGLECRDDEALRRTFRGRCIRTLLFCCVFFVVIPAAIYFLSYIPFFRYEASVRSTYGPGDAVRTILQQQKSMYSYHSGLTATHLCQSAWYQWPFTEKGVWFYVRSAGDKISNITSCGSPAVWWVSAVGFLALCTENLFGRYKTESRAARLGVYLLLIAVAADLFPWLTVSRCTFQYHFFPTLPFMLLGALEFLRHLEEGGTISPKLKWVWLGLAAVYFVLLYPSASGLPTSRMYASFVEKVLPTGLIYYSQV